MNSWYENDEFWAEIEAALFNPRRLEMAPGDVDGVIKLLGIEPGARVLDLCCGPGRHAAELARRGYSVVGVDRNPRYLERAEMAAPEVEFFEGDMREFVREGEFDAVINLYTSFGYFEDEGENVRVLENVKKSLKGGGAFLIDTQGKETLALKFEERRWSEQGDAHLLQESRVVDDWAWVESRWILVRGGEQKEFIVRVRLYSATEMKAMLNSVGFKKVEVFGSLDGKPYDHQAERLVAVAR
jgi:SAM-dependent methyltransferase